MFGLTFDGAIARLTLERPEARNAIPAAGWAALEARIGEAGRSDARVLLVDGAGEAFCAGADLGDFPAMQDDADAAAAFRLAMRGAIEALRNLAVPSVAAIDGPCFGAGVALAMACDLRIAGRGARFAITPAKIGISYPQEDIFSLVALVGPAQAARLLFTAGTIDADEALAIGLVEQVDPPGGAEGVAAAIAANAPESLATLKRGLRLASEGRRSDAGQDRIFDALVSGDELARRLEALRRK